jgi:hypothetical protein
LKIILTFLGFINDQVLKMQWLNDSVRWVLERLLSVSVDSRLGSSIHFFIYDTIKIFLLLSVLIYLVSYLQSYFPPEKVKKTLTKFQGLSGNILGALLGTVTPFCSCSSIPLFIGFTEAGLPIGVSFSFLISSPLVDLAAFLVLVSTFGLKIALAYVFLGIVLAVVGGRLINNLGMEKYVEDYVWKIQINDLDTPPMTSKERFNYAKGQVVEVFQRVWLYVIIGVFIGAFIHNWIPTSVVEGVVGSKNPFSVVLATLIGVPMYADIFGTIPVAEALFLKGAGVGTVLSFMMGVTALSVPSVILLRKVVKPQLLWLFVGIVTIGIIIIGYLFNIVGYLLI